MERAGVGDVCAKKLTMGMLASSSRPRCLRRSMHTSGDVRRYTSGVEGA